MRSLTAKQKAILKRYTDAFSVDDLPVGIWAEIEALHDYETLWQDANRFLSDQYFATGKAYSTRI